MQKIKKTIDSLLCEGTDESLLNWLDKFPRVYIDTTEYPVTIVGPQEDLVKMVSNVDMFWEFGMEVRRLYNVSYMSFRVVE